MKSEVLHSLILGCFSLCVYYGYPNKAREVHEWTKLFMVHHWPATVCKEAENDCRDPPNYWTIHGLWPDKAEVCNRSWHFNLDEIKDLLPDMKQFWPDIIHSSPNRSQFWKHEWEKHGTCAAQLDILNSQKKYFGKSLDLYKKIDLNSVLLKFGIEPSNTYQISDIKKTLCSWYGVIPKIQCLPPEQEKAQIIGQIELCFTKNLELRNCTDPEVESTKKTLMDDVSSESPTLHVCDDGPAYYPPAEEPEN
ncbi:ribonuclease T2 isoform X1 [Ornithorhynchus anatinus]|uniref:Ribonuclease T2 n=1 Tax=Ornithorhynchus anatinus TaxID=9258 RepID=A0A6I8NLL2_ORNAN|nr:ribonuclease T2 isoform X1 [Ornithorhynchus anatinus]XP_028904973.1 ribonuclease T2 isoform X1 [Ornithorhynchus anatinus]XP_028904974.1 ribonuclease T2 isoform X1 [Ornithorhynchus anatinus]XP_028904976.1 ribonuclease T2 isoform X1 [Ornithorhynchus anatinus]